MNKGNWWFKLEYLKWLTDEALSGCSLETQGFWMRVICLMHKAGSPEITGTLDQVARMVGCFPEELMRCSVELKQKNVGDVTLGNGTVTLLSRRLKRSLSDKEKTRLRVRKHRSNSDVTVQSKSNKKEVREEEELCVGGDYLETVLSGVRSRLEINILRDESGWADTCAWAWGEKFTPDQILECFDLVRRQKWRKGNITPKVVADNLPNLKNLREENEKPNGNKQRDTDSDQSTRDYLRSIGVPDADLLTVQ